jgi:hypothetical protein
MTTRRYVMSALLIWMLPLVLCGILPLLWHNDIYVTGCKPICEMLLVLKLNYFKILMIPAFGMVSIVLIGMYVRIFRIAHVPMTRIREQERTTTNAQANDKDDNRKHQLKLLKTGFIVFASLYACWLPFFLISSVQVYEKDFHNDTIGNIRLVTMFH